MTTPPAPFGAIRRLLLALVILFLGGSGLVYEYSLSTLATHLLGNSVQQFSIIIALMLFAMGIAGLAQRSLHHPDRVAETFVIVETVLGLVGGASAILLYLAFAYLSEFSAALYGLALLIGFGIGLEIPLLLRINQQWQAKLRDNVGEVLALDYIGALVGALIWAFILLPSFPLDQISLFLGLANMGVAAITLIAFWRAIHRKALVISVLVVCAGTLAALTAAAPEMVERARQHLYADPIRHHTKSAFQDIVVTGTGARMSLYLNGHLQFDSEDEFIYHELLVHPPMLALGRAPKRVLVLGGGDGLAVREILRWPSVREVLLVDLDPAVTHLAQTYPPLVALSNGALNDPRVQHQPGQGITEGAERPVFKAGESPRLALHNVVDEVARVRVMHMDADVYVRHIEGRWDVIIADFPDPSSPDLAKLFSLEFYQQLRKRLTADGVLMVQSSSPYANRGAYWAVRDTLEAADFGVTSLHTHVPTFGEWGWHLARQGTPPDPQGRPPFATRFIEPAVLAAARVFPRPMTRPEGAARVSTRLDPQVMQLYLRGESLDGTHWFPGTSDSR
jgi:spermidine synthase